MLTNDFELTGPNLYNAFVLRTVFKTGILKEIILLYSLSNWNVF